MPGEQSPFAPSSVAPFWQGTGTVNSLPGTEDVPITVGLADKVPSIEWRRSHSTPDLANLAAVTGEEPSPSFSFHDGMPRGELRPRRSTSMPEGHNIKLLSDSDLIALAERMQQGLNIRDRVHNFKKYPCCFTGSDAVKWLIRSGNAGSEGEALLLGNDMLRAGLLHHVKYKRPFEKNGNLYRFLDVPSGDASTATEDVLGGSPKSQPDLQDFASFERLYDGVWARRAGDNKSNGLAPALRGTQLHEGFSTHSELALLQRKVAEVAAELEESKQLNNVFLDSLTLQLKNEQQLFALQQHRLDRAIRRGTWLAVQLQIVWVLLIYLAAWVMQQHLAQQQQPSVFSQTLVHVLALAATLGALSCRPWLLPAPRKLSEAGLLPPAAGAAAEAAPGHDEGKEGEGSRVDVAAEASSRQPGLVAEGEENRGADRGEPSKMQTQSQDVMERLAQPPAEEDFAEWQDAPLLLRAAPLPYQRLPAGADPCAIRINDGRRIEFETDLFRGCAVIWVDGVASTPAGLFSGQRRKTSITIQGCFKKELAVEDVVTGQEFGRQPKNLPAMWLVDTVLIKLAKKVSPSMDIGPLSAPYLLAPILAMAQQVNVSRPGEQPDPAQPIPEDMCLFDPALVGANGCPMDALKRKKHFWDRRARAGRSFTPGHVWTFQLYQHFVDLGAYELNILYGFDLSRHLDGQPLQFMLKDRGSGLYLFSFHAWHKKLLPAALAADKRQAKAKGASRTALDGL